MRPFLAYWAVGLGNLMQNWALPRNPAGKVVKDQLP